MNSNYYYRYNITRNKGPKGYYKIKKEILNREKCYICKEVIKHNHLKEVEHKIPVMLAGPIFEINNLELVCKKCHINKTIIDKIIINFFKTSKIIHSGAGDMISNIDINKLHCLYYQLFYIIKLTKIKYDDWNSLKSFSEKDFKAVFHRDNRELNE